MTTKPASFQVTHYALSGDGGHVFVGLTDAPAAVEPKRKDDCIGEVVRVSRSQLVIGGHGPTLERRRVRKRDGRSDGVGGAGRSLDVASGGIPDKKPRPEGDTGRGTAARGDRGGAIRALTHSAHEIRRPGN